MKKVFYGDLKRGRVKNNSIGKISKKEIEKYEKQIEEDRLKEKKKQSIKKIIYTVFIFIIPIIAEYYINKW